jgi:hypothetical protein
MEYPENFIAVLEIELSGKRVGKKKMASKTGRTRKINFFFFLL